MEAGVDEAGRGCLAGPVCAAAVILNPDREIDGLNDSKKLSETERYRLEVEIMENSLFHSVAFCSNEEIDAMNILRASITAMHRALDGLKSRPELILVDGNRFYPYQDINYELIIKGDSKFQSIAAASILAKCARDRLMEKLHSEYDVYAWDRNKGYPTIEHRDAIVKHGYCSYHRKSFKLTPDSQLKIFPIK